MLEAFSPDELQCRIALVRLYNTREPQGGAMATAEKVIQAGRG
jgi:hypothetical protein